MTERINPLLEQLKRIPGETYRLPSRGMFYNNGELDPEVKNGEVVVYPMTTIEELLMQTPDAIFQGSAIEKTILACVPQVKKPKQLLALDIDFLLTCIRKVSFGDDLPIKYKCKSCGEEAKEHEYNIPLSHFIKNTKEITKDDYENCIINLDNKFEVKLKPVTFEELLKLLQLEGPKEEQTTEEKIEALDKVFVESMAALIERINTVDDKEMIKEFLSQLYRNLKEELSEQIQQRNRWGIEFNYEITCKECKKKENISTYLNPTSFFMLPSSRKTKKK